MYHLIIAIEEDGKIIDKTTLWKIATRGLAFALLAEWSNFIKEQLKSMIEHGDIT